MSKNSISQIPRSRYSGTEWAISLWQTAGKKTKNNELYDLKNGYAFKKPKPEKEKVPEEKGPPEEELTMDQLNSCTRTLGIISLILLPLAFIFAIVGAATPYWFNHGSYTLGLFQYCNTENSVCDSINDYLTSDSATVTWRLTTGLVLGGASVLAIASVCVCCLLAGTRVTRTKACIGLFLLILIMFGCGATISGVVAMTSYYIDNGQAWTLNWSFYLCAVGAGISFLAVCSFLVYLCLFTFGKHKEKK